MARMKPNSQRGRNRRRAADYRPAKRRTFSISPIMIMLPLAAFTVVFFWGGPPPGLAIAFNTPGIVGADTEAARFAMCSGAVRVNCVIDGDTFWYRGEKIRIADINTPEIGGAECAEERALGQRAARRLQVLLNQGPFTLSRGFGSDDRDRYDRLLRTVTREGESLGGMLVSEGLAEMWKGYRSGWC